jgi:cation diffusion facilitator CzcD-associated flavoprotein CzcO
MPCPLFVEIHLLNTTNIVPGAGQSGLTTAARLKTLNVDTLVIDHEDRVGDNWRRRYRHLVLHDPVCLNHMPYLKFPPQWPKFTPKDKLAEFFEAYVTLLELNVWTKTKVVSSTWDESSQRWTVVLERTTTEGTSTRTLHPAHIIQATGHAGPKHMPVIKGMESFNGNISHSTEFNCAKPNGQGKKAVVVGSSNSAHDICQDFYEQGYDVTMVQRSSTLVISSKFRNTVGVKGAYTEDGPPTEDADLRAWSMPMELFKTQQKKICQLQNQHDAELLEGLTKAGFQLDRGVDDTGYMMKYLHRGGGYYVDVGASRLVIDGKIKLKQGAEISEILPQELLFSDGTRLPADEIVFATGFQNMRTQTRVIFGDSVADRVEDVWGFDPEGEVRTIWRRTGHPGFWYMGTNFAYCRYFSRIVALQIKAIQEGITHW